MGDCLRKAYIAVARRPHIAFNNDLINKFPSTISRCMALGRIRQWLFGIRRYIAAVVCWWHWAVPILYMVFIGCFVSHLSLLSSFDIIYISLKCRKIIRNLTICTCWDNPIHKYEIYYTKRRQTCCCYYQKHILERVLKVHIV